MSESTTKFARFLQEHKIDPRRLLAVSKRIERLRPEDKNIRIAKKRVRDGEDVPEDVKKLAQKKPRSGRPVTAPLLRKAMEGQKLTRKAKQRLLRAVNHVLQQRKESPVDASALF